MKYLNIYEKFSDQDYLKDVKKYSLIKSSVIENYYVINKNLNVQFQKIYDIIDGNLIKINLKFYYTIPKSKYYKEVLYQSDDLQEILDNYKILINSKKYNI